MKSNRIVWLVVVGLTSASAIAFPAGADEREEALHQRLTELFESVPEGSTADQGEVYQILSEFFSPEEMESMDFGAYEEYAADEAARPEHVFDSSSWDPEYLFQQMLEGDFIEGNPHYLAMTLSREHLLERIAAGMQPDEPEEENYDGLLGRMVFDNARNEEIHYQEFLELISRGELEYAGGCTLLGPGDWTGDVDPNEEVGCGKYVDLKHTRFTAGHCYLIAHFLPNLLAGADAAWADTVECARQKAYDQLGGAIVKTMEVLQEQIDSMRCEAGCRPVSSITVNFFDMGPSYHTSDLFAEGASYHYRVAGRGSFGCISEGS